MNETVIRTLSLLLVFGMVFLLSEYALSQVRRHSRSTKAINDRLRMIARGEDPRSILANLRKAVDGPRGGTSGPFFQGLMTRLARMAWLSGVRMPANQLLLYMLAAFAILFALILCAAIYLGFGITAGIVEIALVIGIGLGIIIPSALISRAAQKKLLKIQSQFPLALDIFVRGLKAGHPIASALALLATEMEDPIGSEFGIVTDEVSYGADLREALNEMANRWDLDDMRMFVVSLSVQSETGGNLAEILENLARVIRERANMYMMVRALSSEGRMSAQVLTLLPILTFALVFTINPAFYLEYARDPIFILSFTVLIGLYLLGVLIIRQMVDLKV
jgi:tight adherence protein B